MKKEYSKPVIIYDDFRLSANIAADCAFATHHAEYQCPYTVGTRTIFLDEAGGCTTITQDGSEYGLCYHNPSDSNNLFSS